MDVAMRGREDSALNTVRFTVGGFTKFALDGSRKIQDAILPTQRNASPSVKGRYMLTCWVCQRGVDWSTFRFKSCHGYEDQPPLELKHFFLKLIPFGIIFESLRDDSDD